MNITRKLSDLIVQIMYQIQWEKKWPDDAERNLLKLNVVEVLNKLEVRYWNTNDPDCQKNNVPHKFFN